MYVISLNFYNVCISNSVSFNIAFKSFIIRNSETPPSTPQRNRDALRREEREDKLLKVALRFFPDPKSICVLCAAKSSRFFA